MAESAIVKKIEKSPYRRVNTPIDTKKSQHFVLWRFYVRLGVLDNVLKVGQNWSMGRCPISKTIVVDLQGIFLHFYPRFQLQYFTWKCYQWCWIIPYTYLGLPVHLALPSVALIILYSFNFYIIKTCKAGLVLSVTHILRAALTEFPVCVCMYVCVTTPPKPLNRFA